MRLPAVDSAVGKMLKVALWVAVSGAVSALIAWAGGLDSASLAWLWPIVNVVLVAVKNFADGQVHNY